MCVCVCVGQSSTRLEASQHEQAEGRLLPEEADGADLEAKPLVWIPEIVQHDVDDGNLVDAWSVNLQHGSSVALLLLKRQRKEEISSDPVSRSHD